MNLIEVPFFVRKNKRLVEKTPMLLKVNLAKELCYFNMNRKCSDGKKCDLNRLGECHRTDGPILIGKGK
jgi:hypothetical protein